ncbi:GNAT family N-acetyltransferase [Brevibacillus agri]|uniref:GNAT family N-acetyltransferase n=2 Tax=Brevibacillus agri TaxID=51101 RepID=UPI001C8D4999|nr:GNAT family N-acetyltransferase [Brevibacillus agri]MBY0053152.1 GNAT family N-acetyltransferase [Brevibacillus agri]MCG5252898.1 GNAT family N-acetyltransferase [Brevibacillus agri]MDN4095844.1 GNAT family N-acetyltransferase [Brevibacillus agri]MED1646231.1 GNAT family N-acetyltransferase [Brevibacillus agri]MED1654174.1 GNAT family N-acetyltransferase [Brevibacillus agri]
MILPMNREQVRSLAPISLEQSYILYGNVALRAERSLFAADVEEGELRAVGSYLQGMPFHAFSLQLFAAERDYEVTEMLNYFREHPAVDLAAGQTGVFAVPHACLKRVTIPGTLSQREMQLMKLVRPEKLLAPGESRLLASAEAEVAVELAQRIGMISFRAEEVVEMPHIALFSEQDEPMALAGFHVYEEAFVEIGNIGTSEKHRQKGLGTQITSDVSRLGLEKSPNVYLMVFADNPQAIRVYEKLGYETVSSYAFVEFAL